MLPCHIYQRSKVEEFSEFGSRVVNVACKEDPARLGADYGAINCDVNDYDPQEKMSLYEVANFRVGDACNLPFGDSSFDILVLGEFLEHCPYESAVLALSEVKRVLTDKGKAVLTFPYDSRPKEVQHEPHLLVTWKHGITSWHQSVWDDESLERLLKEVGLRELPEHRSSVPYGFCVGAGVVLVKE